MESPASSAVDIYGMSGLNGAHSGQGLGDLSSEKAKYSAMSLFNNNVYSSHPAVPMAHHPAHMPPPPTTLTSSTTPSSVSWKHAP